MSALNSAESRLNDLYADQARMEEEMAARIEVAEKLRAQVKELEREKRDLQRRYNEQVRFCRFSHFIHTWIFRRHRRSRQSVKPSMTMNSTSDLAFSLLLNPASSLKSPNLLMQPIPPILLLRSLPAPTMMLRKRQKYRISLAILKNGTVLLNKISTTQKANQLK